LSFSCSEFYKLEFYFPAINKTRISILCCSEFEFFFAFTFLLHFPVILFQNKIIMYQKRTQVFVGDTQFWSGETTNMLGEMRSWWTSINFL